MNIQTAYSTKPLPEAVAKLQAGLCVEKSPAGDLFRFGQLRRRFSEPRDAKRFSGRLCGRLLDCR